MSTFGKSIATTISMIVLVLSLAVVCPTTAIGKGIKRTGNPARSQQGTNLKGRNVSPSLRSAASVTRNPKRGAIVAADFKYTEIRRTNQMFHGTSGDGEKFLRSRKR